ncbi:Nup93/Nic96-domain-containing protein [Haematococcus lacustris]
MTDWSSLLSDTQSLVTQDFHSFPRVERNLAQLQQYAQTLRARAGNFRSLNNQIAATRLLAQQGFDTSRLTQDVTTLDIQPTIEDVFHADTTSVEEYLRQVEESTILTTIQEAQQNTVAVFDAYMDDCMAHDWAASKRQLYGLIAPHHGSGPALGSTGGAGAKAPGGGGSLFGTPARGPLQGGGGGGGDGSRLAALPPNEQAYVEVVRRANEAVAAGNAGFDLAREFRDSCKPGRAASSGPAAPGASGGADSSMRACWSLLVDMLAEARGRGVGGQAAAGGSKFVEALAAGGRKHLERGHCQHMRNTLLRHKVAAERGADPEPLREVQAYVQVKLGGGAGRGPLDFQSPGGLDTSWMQVYFSLRNGWVDAARKAAQAAYEPALSRLGEGGFRSLLDDWLRLGGRLPERTATQLARVCESLLHDKAALSSQPKQPYLVLVLALLAGDVRSCDALAATLAALKQPSVLTTIEDYMWSKLTLFQAGQTGAAPSSSSPLPMSSSLDRGSLLSGMASGFSSGLLVPYGLAELHADINRWPAAYYTKQGSEPLLYVTVLLLSLQFNTALAFLWKDEMARAFRVDSVHLAIALWQERLLAITTPGAEPGPDVGALVHAYGRKLVHLDSGLALSYYMLAAAMQGNSIAVKGQMLRELLSESRDFGSLLGGGSAPGGRPGGALAAYVPDPEERKRLFEAVAYECQVAAQPEEAVELYLAADRPRQALALLNQQLSLLLPSAAQEAASGLDVSGAAISLKRVLVRARDARARIPATADSGSRREVEALQQLQAVWELLLAAAQQRHDLALQKLHELSFVPLEKARVEQCVRVAQSGLHPAVQERLQDVLAVAAHTISALKDGASREKCYTLRTELDALCQFANSVSFRVPRVVYQKLCEAASCFS